MRVCGGRSEDLLIQLERLKRAGWNVELLAPGTDLPPQIIERYRWLPREIMKLVSTVGVAVSADEKAWILSAADYRGTATSAFAWNEWERLSLSAAGDDERWRSEITGFWDRNFPLVMSVKSGYAYFAVERDSLAVVVGEEPVFEEPHQVARSVSRLFRMIARGDRELSRWL
jgi:hypothetical protein